MANNTYTIGYFELLIGDWVNDTIQVLILDDSAVPNFDPTHRSVAEVLADAGNNEMNGTGYARKTVPGRAIIGSALAIPGDVTLDHDDIVYTGADAGTMAAAVYFRQGTNDSNSPVIFFRDGGFPLATTGVDATLATDAAGLVTVTLGRRQGIRTEEKNLDTNGIRHADLNIWSDVHTDLAVS